uniref:Pleckstrin homology domain containing, family M (with RUN domain) member 1 n=1 Tax=Astyanax mexicanus TaxID=7994 RepID=W5LPV3_ASTMX
MLATQTADSVPEAKNAKQWIKEKIAQTLKALQKRYVTTDAAVTSEDLEANQLCCALEAVFIHGLRSKHIRTDGAGARGRKGPALPQPVFWSLLKSVTHRQDLTKEDVDMVSPPSDNSPRPSSPNKQHTPPPLSADTSGPDTPSTVPEEEITAEIPSKPEPEPEPAVVTRPAATEHSVQQESQSKPSVSSTPAVPTSTISNSVTPRNPPVASGALRPEENPGRSSAQRSCSVVSRKTSSGSLFNSPSWISEEDFYKPDPYGSGDSEGPDVSDVTQMNGTVSPASPELASHQSPPCVVHRLSNPFRGLLKLGQLERRVTLGMWKDFYCELSPFELRLYTDAEERSCCENCSLLRCEDVRLSSAAEGRFRLSFPGKKLELRAPSRGEAEDWVDRIVEAVNKARPAARDEHWEVLQASPTTPLFPPHPPTDWTRPADPEPDAIKEAVVCLGQEERGWRSLVLSLSLEALRGFSVQEGRKMPVFSHPIEAVRDVVPDAALGGPAFFKVLMGKETLTVRAESGEEARTWRSLIRGALDSYLETQDDGMAEEVMSPGGGQGGNINRLVQHRLKGDGVLLPYLTTVPTERGLDAQSFKCAGCPRQVGVSLGRARLCEFSGQYYCEGCHHGDTTIIPSRMVHNWDLTPREVSGPALKLLANIKQEPLLNLDLLNPDLFNHTEVMAAVQCLRQKLRLLGDYLLICRSGVRKKIEARLNQRMYLLESSSLYSVLDLKEIADGQYEGFLQSQIQFSSSHVHHCDLCTQRGFICQICNTDDIIFPFQFETTTRCTVCKTVFHSSCKAQNLSCPRCERRQRYHERVLLR